ncbi:hypothetical protein CJ483_23995 [Bacillus sp. PK3_68]|nr:hypothetical protein CJ483_23995 [Bacillus sp. PK3_68]
MSANKERFIFMRELIGLYDECERCKDTRVKEEIIKDLVLLKKLLIYYLREQRNIMAILLHLEII